VELVKETAAETGMALDAGRGRDHVVTTDRRVSVVAGWTQGIFGNVEDGAYFWVRDFLTRLPSLACRVSFPFAPKLFREHKFTADVSQARDLVWKRSGSKQQIVADGLADQVVVILLELISRANRGKVEMQYL
jgi:hypothetical protein